MEIYFRDRLDHLVDEEVLVPFGSSSDARQVDLPNMKTEIWNLWKWVNEERETLPIPSKAVNRDSKLTLHHWAMVKEDSLPYFFIEKGEGAGVPKNLFLNLHGSGPKDMELKATLAWSLRYKDAPSLYFIPQIPNERRYRWWLKSTQLAWERLFRLAMLNPEVDPNGLFVMGISEGGYGSQRLGAFYADYLAGAGPMAGGEPLKNAPPLNYRHLAFSFQTGENDSGFGRHQLTLSAKKAFDSLANIFPGDFVHKIELQEGKGHGIDYTVTTPWLSLFKRKVNPSHVTWIWFPMDGRYRKGFYNIAINSSPVDTIHGTAFDRVLFDMDVDRKTNTVTLVARLRNENMDQQATPQKGKISIYLDDNLVDLDRKVKVIYNGKLVHHGKMPLSTSALAESCALFGDPYRLYPTKIEITL